MPPTAFQFVSKADPLQPTLRVALANVKESPSLEVERIGLYDARKFAESPHAAQVIDRWQEMCRDRGVDR